MPRTLGRHEFAQHGLFREAFMGRKFDEVGEEIKRVPYKVVKGSNGDAAIEVEVNGKPEQFSPQEISAMILSKLKADA